MPNLATDSRIGRDNQRAGARAGPSSPDLARWTVAVGAFTFLAYATTLPMYELRVTDLSALRVAHGLVPYRDFWTMYAPGSYLTLGAAFAGLGEQLIVSRALGMLTAAAAVAACFRLAARCVQPQAALLPALVFATTFFGTKYYSGFGSYPPAILAVLVAANILAAGAAARLRPRAVALAGICLGAGIVFKHDVAGYALLVAAVATLAVTDSALHGGNGIPGRIGARVWPAIVLVAAALVVVVVPLATLVLLGAGGDMLRDLVIFPLTDFPHVRGEYFPLVPRIRSGTIETAKEVIRWATCNLPTIALLAGVPGLWRRRRLMTAPQRFVIVFAVIAFPLYWLAAHVQINTHAVTLAALGAIVGTAGLATRRDGARWRTASVTTVLVVVAAWCAVVTLERGYEVAQRFREGTQPLSLPRLAGMTVTRGDAVWMRGLAREMESAAGPDAPLLVVGNRNDVLVYADTTPYWLSARPPATRYHELHPAITDTAVVQREMLAELARHPLPVVVREHRFNPALLEAVKARWLGIVPVGATALDEWVASHYRPGARLGRYEVMRRRNSEQ